MRSFSATKPTQQTESQASHLAKCERANTPGAGQTQFYIFNIKQMKAEKPISAQMVAKTARTVIETRNNYIAIRTEYLSLKVPFKY